VFSVDDLRMHRKATVLLTIVIAGLILSLGYTIVMIRDLHDLHDQISVLRDENRVLRECLTAFPSMQPVIQIGRDYLEGLGMTTGKLLSIRLMEKAPIYYYNYTKEDIARAKETGEFLPLGFLGDPRLCWVIQFEKANRPGHFGVWIDANTSKIIGMQVTASCLV